MNPFFYEVRGKEKVRELRDEGIRSQAYHASGASKVRILGGLSRLILVIAGLLGVLLLLIR